MKQMFKRHGCLKVATIIRLDFIISTYEFSRLYTTLPQLVGLIENTFRRKEVLYLACNEEGFFRFGRKEKL